jgi:hypothetical protein
MGRRARPQCDQIRPAGSGIKPAEFAHGLRGKPHRTIWRGVDIVRPSPRQHGKGAHFRFDEQSSNRLDTILADRNRTAISPMISRFPCLRRWSGFPMRFGSVTGEVFPGSDRVMAAQC